MKGEKRCVICRRKHSKNAYFPKDFPNKWKMCCFCRNTADIIICQSIEDAFRYSRGYSSCLNILQGKIPKVIIRRKVKKINRLISLK